MFPSSPRVSPSGRSSGAESCMTVTSALPRRRGEGCCRRSSRRPAGIARAAGRRRRAGRAPPARARSRRPIRPSSAPGRRRPPGPGRSSTMPSLNQSCAMAARIGGARRRGDEPFPVPAPAKGGATIVERAGGVHDDPVVDLGQHPVRDARRPEAGKDGRDRPLIAEPATGRVGVPRHAHPLGDAARSEARQRPRLRQRDGRGERVAVVGAVDLLRRRS